MFQMEDGMDILDAILAICKTNEEVSELLMLLAIELDCGLNSDTDRIQ